MKPALFLLGLVLLAHLPALRAVDFHYDDGHSIVRNPHVRNLANLPRFFADPTLFGENPADAMYRPVVLVAHAVSQYLSPDSASGFLGLNLALHGAATLLLFRVLTVLVPGGALLGAMLFALHPLQTEVVNYVSARSESLVAVGILLAVLAFCNTDPRRDRVAVGPRGRPASCPGCKGGRRRHPTAAACDSLAPAGRSASQCSQSTFDFGSYISPLFDCVPII